jgi:superfamily II DNA or RNA helicase
MALPPTLRDEGAICVPTTFGKTVVGAALIAARRVNTLVLVHRQQLLDQCRERLVVFLDLQSSQSARISYFEYGHLIVDERHHISSFTFEQVMK